MRMVREEKLQDTCEYFGKLTQRSCGNCTHLANLSILVQGKNVLYVASVVIDESGSDFSIS